MKAITLFVIGFLTLVSFWVVVMVAITTAHEVKNNYSYVHCNTTGITCIFKNETFHSFKHMKIVIIKSKFVSNTASIVGPCADCGRNTTIELTIDQAAGIIKLLGLVQSSKTVEGTKTTYTYERAG